MLLETRIVVKDGVLATSSHFIHTQKSVFVED